MIFNLKFIVGGSLDKLASIRSNIFRKKLSSGSGARNKKKIIV